MDNHKLAELIFPDIKEKLNDLEKKFPSRNLPKNAYVTRFAPSPTGYMHIGGLYTAMLSKILARRTQGVFYLRIEDTDKKREVKGGIQGIVRALEEFHILFDEGPIEGQETIYGPYQQSKRKRIYQICVKELIKKGLAYPCFCSKEDLEELRREQEKQKAETGYYGEYAKCRHLTYEEIEEKIKNKKPYVIRLKSPGNPEKKILYQDPIRGEISMPENCMDLVLLKSDGVPTYHLAHVVDDHFMGTNLVLRGDEWLSSYPIHKQLFDVLEFSIPSYVHISPIMKFDGNGKRKLSKRKDLEAGVEYYLEQGYPVESVQEYLMTIANSNFEEWRKQNPTLQIEEFPFSFEKMSISGALLDMKKLDDISKEMIASMSLEECYQKILAWAEMYHPGIYQFAKERPETFKKSMQLWRISGKRIRKDISRWSQLPELFDYLYENEQALKLNYEIDETLTKDQMIEVIKAYQEDLFLQSEEWFEQIKELAIPMGYCGDRKKFKKNPELYQGTMTDFCTVIRVAVTGRKNSPDLQSIMQLLGETVVKHRLRKFENFLREQ